MAPGVQPPSVRITPHLIFGLLIIFVGIAFTLDNLDIAEVDGLLRYWPSALMLIGVAKLWQARAGYGSGLTGVLIAGTGGWLQLEALGYVDQSVFELWPMLLVIAGGALVWQGLRGRHERRALVGDSTINAIAVLAGVNRGSNSSAFRGGELTAVMGGCEIDLRHAAIHGEAIIDVFAMWGGIEIRVPEDWRVIGRVTPVMGGFEEKTRPPHGAAEHTLVVRGFVLMGGVEVKN